ncbi:DNA replication/repair protein RecF [Defluviitalea phaphyphila]|uniref:DNA replication/repair protein RecF n=1 Tax=Defluviitalea phaphyphila TaxID=1473580 RepID=UPI0007315CB7|nr:DNA replication/repair protein RecF [Defluviitalea phaphyphila]
MYISEVNLYQFRNYNELTLSLHPKLNILYGENAQGKTNLLESIYLCATGRSHRTTHEKEVIRWENEETHIRTFLNKKNHVEKIDFHLKKNGKKSAALNGIPIQRLGELLGIMNVVLFSPEDLQLIKSGPRQRRRFLDIELCQLDRMYFYNLQKYHKVLKQRNYLLKNINSGKDSKDMLNIWDEQLVYFGEKIIEKRKDFIDKINNLAFLIHRNITDKKEELLIGYIPSVDKNEFMGKLKYNIQKDIQNKTTSLGPHRDDISFKINGMDLKTYGSQGQQRTAALSLKLSEIELIKKEIDESPILLLDDVLSELDENRQKDLIESIDDIQTILTCTGIEDIILKQKHRGSIFYVKNGNIKIKNFQKL